MTNEQRAALARIFRRHAEFMAELPLLEAILDVCEDGNKAPKDWRKLREVMRDSDEYKATLAEFEPIIQQLQTSSDDDELIRLLQKISTGKLPN